MDGAKPRRLEDASKMRRMLADDLPNMRQVVVHNRPNFSDSSQQEADRTRRGCVLIEVWEEADGSESIVISGDSSMENLEIKGLLHDGIYSISHQGDAGFAP